jgi:hypothetical protein
LREADQVRAGNVMVMADLAAPHSAKETLGCVRVDFLLCASTVGVFMVDPDASERLRAAADRGKC